MSLKYREKSTPVEVDRFFPQIKPWPIGIEQYTTEKTESVGGDKNEWFGWRIETHLGYAEVSPLDYIVYKENGEILIYNQKDFFNKYEMIPEENTNNTNTTQ